VGTLLLLWPEEKEVAYYANDRWHLEKHKAAGFECTHYADLRFTDPVQGASEILGPFDYLSFAKGCLYADRGLVAEFVADTARWRHCETGVRWRAILITPAAPCS
jgi:hypothetical protein